MSKRFMVDMVLGALVYWIIGFMHSPHEAMMLLPKMIMVVPHLLIIGFIGLFVGHGIRNYIEEVNDK